MSAAQINYDEDGCDLMDFREEGASSSEGEGSGEDTPAKPRQLNMGDQDAMIKDGHGRFLKDPEGGFKDDDPEVNFWDFGVLEDADNGVEQVLTPVTFTAMPSGGVRVQPYCPRAFEGAAKHH